MCTSPSKLPLDSARRAPGTERGYSFSYLNAETRTNDEYRNYPCLQLGLVGARSSRAAPGRGDPFLLF